MSWMFFFVYVGTFFAMAIGLILAVHRVITAEAARVAKQYNAAQLQPQEPTAPAELQKAA